MNLKQCVECKKTKPATVEYFYRCTAAKDGLNSWCKQCNSKACREYNQTKEGIATRRKYQRSEKGKQTQKRYAATVNGRRSRRNNSFKSKYGFTLEQYEQMFIVQKGLCAICTKPETAKNRYGLRFLAIDHNHSTGKIRSLLCDRCNRMLGFAKESPKILRAAIEYLELNDGR